ncbi:MAG: hypothetical protein EOP48_27800 [Sphingobacteriales bacterium]|nr:MAG: hypothetical protein EOP48_27800 [Sphingobacteriales bacterium]
MNNKIKKSRYCGGFLNTENPSPKLTAGWTGALGARRLPIFFLSRSRNLTFTSLSEEDFLSSVDVFFLVPTAFPDDLVLSGPL